MWPLCIQFLILDLESVRLGVNNQVHILRQVEKNSKAFWCQYQIYVGDFHVLHVQHVHNIKMFSNFNYAVKTHREQTQSHISTSLGRLAINNYSNVCLNYKHWLKIIILLKVIR